FDRPDHFVEVDGLRFLLRRIDRGKMQDPFDHGQHPVGGGVDLFKVRAAFCREFRSGVFLQSAAVYFDFPHRFPEVMAGDMGKLAQVLIRLLQTRVEPEEFTGALLYLSLKQARMLLYLAAGYDGFGDVLYDDHDPFDDAIAVL